MSANGINKIKSKYCMKIIFSHVNEINKMKIINYNKNLQSKLDIGIHNYIFHDVYKKISEDKKDIKYINFNSILNILKNITNENRQNEIIIALCKDLNIKYSNKIFIKLDINDLLSFSYFQLLSSIQPPIKIILLLSPGDYYDENKYYKIIKSFIKIIENCDNKIGGFDFDINFGMSELKLMFPKAILDIMNKSYKNIEYLRISCEFLNYLISEKYFNFLYNDYKLIKIFANTDSNINEYENFITLFKNIKNNFKPNELRLKKYDTEYPEDNNYYYSKNENGDDKFLDLNNMGSLNKLKLDKLYSFCQFNQETVINLNKLYINHTFIDYSENNIKFSNLKYLTIKDTILDSVLNSKNINFDSFSNLEHLTVDILASIDFLVLKKILKSSANKLIEFNIYDSYDLTESIDGDYYEIYKQGNEKEKEEESEMDIESDFEFEDEVKKINNEFGDTILELKNLKYLRIFNFNVEYNPFINILLEKYSNENLIEFESNIITHSSANYFINNNPNLKVIKLLDEI